ncbi:MAG: hypothetical protein GXP16_00170, partial [Gammaproteobacteria bacterium]|nr:hypothetical protein [Gammaproteobacteria bacterium]
THIFIQHGMWEEVSASNQSAYDTAVALWQPGDNAGDMTHALDWGQYGDLQLGDYQRAQLWIERMAAILPDNRDQLRIQAALPRVKARYVIESRRWQIKAITEHSADTELFATGISAIHLDQLDVAEVVVDRLQERAGQLQSELDPSYYARNGKPVLIMYHQVAGALNIAQGNIDLGLDHLGKGVTVAESMRPPNGAPNPIKPAHEFYAEYLLSSNRAQRAVEMFTISLSRTPNRPLSLLGLARSYVALGHHDEATAAYRKLAAIWKGKDFPELTEANRFLTARR